MLANLEAHPPRSEGSAHLQVLGSFEGHQLRQELEEEEERLLAAAVEAAAAPKSELEAESAA